LPAHAAPGSEVTLQLRNPRATAVHATIAMVDEGVLARLQPWDADQLDPASDAWLGVLKQWSTASWFGFVGWNFPSINISHFGSGGSEVTGQGSGEWRPRRRPRSSSTAKSALRTGGPKTAHALPRHRVLGTGPVAGAGPDAQREDQAARQPDPMARDRLGR
jgi:hypothetical protein